MYIFRPTQSNIASLFFSFKATCKQKPIAQNVRNFIVAPKMTTKLKIVKKSLLTRRVSQFIEATPTDALPKSTSEEEEIGDIKSRK